MQRCGIELCNVYNGNGCTRRCFSLKSTTLYDTHILSTCYDKTSTLPCGVRVAM